MKLGFVIPNCEAFSNKQSCTVGLKLNLEMNNWNVIYFLIKLKNKTLTKNGRDWFEGNYSKDKVVKKKNFWWNFSTLTSSVHSISSLF